MLGRSRRAGNGQKAAAGAVAAEERSALLNLNAGSTDVPPQPPERRPEVSGGDPTQKLLTALGRFRSHVARAEAGAEQEEWSDECMDELIQAVRIAISQDWPELTDALGGAGRVLQTYEQARCAHLCIRFLKDSYSILCSMLDDLIVGNVRPAVMQEWRHHYNTVVAEIEAAGLTLVRDDETGPESYEAPPVPPQVHQMETAYLPSPELPATVEAQDAPGEGEARPAALVEIPESSLEEAPEEEPAAPPAAEEAGISPEDAGILDALCDDLARIEQAAHRDPADSVRAIGGKADSLAEHARGRGYERCVALCETMASLCTLAEKHGRGLDERFLKAAYGFCEAYAEAHVSPDSPVVYNWSVEGAGLIDTWKQEVPAPPQAATPEQGLPEEPEPTEGSLQTLLQSAQRAISDGNVGDAKLIVLEAAASLAKLETARAELRVRVAEEHLQEHSSAIDHGRRQVKEAEQGVVAAEARLAESKRTHEETDARLVQVGDSRTELEERVAQLERRIRQLQAQREAEVERLAQADAEQDDMRRRLAQLEADEVKLGEEVQGARVDLEDIRQEVKNLQRKRSETELVLGQARETLEKHRSSLADIEQTIAQIRGASGAGQEDPGPLLF